MKKAGASAWLLLLPSGLLFAYALVLPMLTFLRYAFYRTANGRLVPDWSLDAFRTFLSDSYELEVVQSSLLLSATVTVLTLAVGYPLAYALWRTGRPAVQKWLALLVFTPVLVSVVVRSYGWMVLLGDTGPANWLLRGTGLAASPVRLVFNATGVAVSLVHVFLPFAVFPILASLLRLDPALREAARDLGAGWWLVFRRVTFPLSLPGTIAAAQICFTLALGAFVTPSMLGGGRVLALPLEVYRETTDIEWPAAAVGNAVLLALAVLAVLGFNRLAAWRQA